MELKFVEHYGEIIKLFPLFHKFFEKTKPDYTKEEFFSQLKWILDNGAVGYIEEDGVPVAYGIMVKARLFHDTALILQVYSERPFLLRKMIKASEDVTRSFGLNKQIAIVDLKRVKYFARHYRMREAFMIMERDLEEVAKEEVG